ncbi:MAG: GTP cyclohydrolase II [bacterium]|nr:GTP cyclohydrolase II [bacterium]
MEVQVFSYVDTDIRRKLEKDKLLIHLDKKGNAVEDKEQNAFISLMGPIPIPRLIKGKERIWMWYPFVRRLELHHVFDSAEAITDGNKDAFRELLQEHISVNSLLASPDFFNTSQPLVRIHSCCMTGDVFGSLRCECGPQLEQAFERIDGEGGAVIYMSGHEGRGIGLWAKAVTYLLQDGGQDTYEANLSLGLPEDSRNFTDAGIVLRYLLKGKPIRLLSNNRLKLEHVEASGQEVAEIISHVTGIGNHNINYMRAKRSKGHLLPELDS